MLLKLISLPSPSDDDLLVMPEERDLLLSSSLQVTLTHGVIAVAQISVRFRFYITKLNCFSNTCSGVLYKLLITKMLFNERS